jgi:hypothetical protein
MQQHQWRIQLAVSLLCTPVVAHTQFNTTAAAHHSAAVVQRVVSIQKLQSTKTDLHCN